MQNRALFNLSKLNTAAQGEASTCSQGQPLLWAVTAGKALQHFYSLAEAQTGQASVDNAHSIKNESPVLPPLPNGYEKIVLVLRKERDSS